MWVTAGRVVTNLLGQHVFWMFIKDLSHTEVCLRVAARSHDLIPPTTIHSSGVAWLAAAERMR
jgi:hypothetical protein